MFDSLEPNRTEKSPSHPITQKHPKTSLPEDLFPPRLSIMGFFTSGNRSSDSEASDSDSENESLRSSDDEGQANAAAAGGAAGKSSKYNKGMFLKAGGGSDSDDDDSSSESDSDSDSDSDEDSDDEGDKAVKKVSFRGEAWWFWRRGRTQWVAMFTDHFAHYPIQSSSFPTPTIVWMTQRSQHLTDVYFTGPWRCRRFPPRSRLGR